MPSVSSLRASAGPMPGSSRTGSGASKAAASLAPITAKPRGLSRPAAILASSRFGARPIETVTPTSASTSRAKRASTTAGGAPCSASVPARSSTASSIDSGCTSGVSLRHQRADLPRHRDVFREVGADHHRVGARLQRLEHRHGAAHAVDARDIAGGGDHAAHAAADDHRLRGELRAVALFHAGVERVAVDMRDGEGEQLRVARRCGGCRRPGSDRRVA